MTLFVASVFFALSVSAICSLLEATVLSLTPSQVAGVSLKHQRAGAIWENFKSRIDRPISVILIVNTTAHTVGATVAGAQFELIYGDEGLIWFSLLFTFLMLQFTEILPKTLGVQYNEKLAPMIALPLAVLVKVLGPILHLVRLINRPFERERDDSPSSTLKEITALARLARLSEVISQHQERIIRRTSQLSDKTAGEVMIPVEQVSFLSTSQSLYEAVIAAHFDVHTRFPICDGGERDKVLGYVNFKEMIYRQRTNPSDTTLEGIIRPVYFAAPDLPASELLLPFVERHEHMAIVQDEQGKTLGLVTLEDVIEQLVGDLKDEFDHLPRMVHGLKGGVWMFGGGVPISDVADTIGAEFNHTVENTSDWLIERFGRVPKPNEIHTEQGIDFMVRRVRRGKVFEVSVSETRVRSGGAAGESGAHDFDGPDTER